MESTFLSRLLHRLMTQTIHSGAPLVRMPDEAWVKELLEMES